MQVSMLLYCLGEDTEDVLTSMNIDEGGREKYHTVLKHFDDFFKVHKNVIFERAKFNSQHQREGEAVEEFITALYNLVKTCKYSALKDEMLRDRLVIGTEMLVVREALDGQ